MGRGSEYAPTADAEERQGGWSPLMYAANAEHPKVVELLFEHGADPARRDRYGRTARDIAAQNPCRTVVRVFDRIERLSLL
jgi:ankyrin repeat protein